MDDVAAVKGLQRGEKLVEISEIVSFRNTGKHGLLHILEECISWLS